MVTDSDTTVTVLRNEHWETVSGLWALAMRGVAPNATERKTYVPCGGDGAAGAAIRLDGDERDGAQTPAACSPVPR